MRLIAFCLEVPIQRLYATVKTGAIVALGVQFLDRVCHLKCRVRYRVSTLASAPRLG